MSYESPRIEAATPEVVEPIPKNSEAKRPTALILGSPEMEEAAERLRRARVARDGAVVTKSLAQLTIVNISPGPDADLLPPAA